MNQSKNIQSILRFSRVTLDKVVYERFDDVRDKGGGLPLVFNCGYAVANENPNKVKVTIEVSTNNDEKNGVIFDVAMTGYFYIDEQDQEINQELKESLLKRSTYTILFPYLRSFITTLTAHSGEKPIIIPPINILALIDDSVSEDAISEE
jgi:preprotein translocase subunit SecB